MVYGHSWLGKRLWQSQVVCSSLRIRFNGFFTCGLMPSIFSEGGTLRPSGRRTCPKSTVNASHHTPKCPISKMVRSSGSVSTIVLRS